ncbi:MAG TPA: ABC transporter ATP-binding protein [Candidatus Limnocylindrales bacterium]|nr:ABC transporter ATP-binding protein [Candidatus Limnocylindrales bacterium]
MSSSSTTPALQVERLVKRYGDVTALRGVDLRVARGEVVALLGPNGAGKTTLISCLLGLRRPSEGSVRVLGGAPDDAATRARTGAMLQESGIPSTLTIAETVDLFRGYYPAPRDRAALLAAAGLEDVAGRRVGRLSGGQRQRLYFALALAGDPDLIFLDEPTTGLDVESRRRFWETVADLAATGTTVLFATHLLEEADALATRIVVINEGRIVRDGTPAEIKAMASGATIRLRTDLDVDVVAAWPGVIRAGRSGARLEIVAARPEEVLRRVFASGVAVDEVAVEERALETAFLDLTASEAAA